MNLLHTGILASSLQGSSSCPTDTDAATYLTAISNSDPTFCTAVDNFFSGLKSNSLYTKTKGFYFLIKGSTNSLVNAKSPGTHNMTAHGGITWASTGASGNGSTGYLGSSFNGTDFTSTSGLIGVGIRTNVLENGYDCGVDDNVSLVSHPTGLAVRYGAGTAYGFWGNGAYDISASSSSSIGFWTVNRLSGTTYLYKNGSAIASNAESATMPAVEITIMAINGNGTIQNFSTKEFYLVVFTDALDGTESSNLNTLVQSFKTDMGI